MTTKPRLHCVNCGKKRKKGDSENLQYCSEKCCKNSQDKYCVMCGKNLSKGVYGNMDCSEECFQLNLVQTFSELNSDD